MQCTQGDNSEILLVSPETEPNAKDAESAVTKEVGKQRKDKDKNTTQPTRSKRKKIKDYTTEEGEALWTPQKRKTDKKKPIRANSRRSVNRNKKSSASLKRKSHRRVR